MDSPLDFDALNEDPVPTYQAAPPVQQTFQTPTSHHVMNRRPSFNSQPVHQEHYTNDGKSLNLRVFIIEPRKCQPQICLEKVTEYAYF